MLLSVCCVETWSLFEIKFFVASVVYKICRVSWMCPNAFRYILETLRFIFSFLHWILKYRLIVIVLVVVRWYGSLGNGCTKKLVLCKCTKHLTRRTHWPTFKSSIFFLNISQVITCSLNVTEDVYDSLCVHLFHFEGSCESKNGECFFFFFFLLYIGIVPVFLHILASV